LLKKSLVAIKIINMKHYDYIILDFDGTIMNTIISLIPLYKKTFKMIGVELTDEMCHEYLGHSLTTCFEWFNVPKERSKELCDYFHEEITKDEVVRLTKPFEDTLRFMDRCLELNIPLGIVSGNASNNIRKLINYHHLEKYNFKDIVGNDLFVKVKPDGEPLLVYFKRNNIDINKTKVLYVGDADQDKYCAINAGVDYLIVRREKAPQEGELSSLDEVISKLN